ncbi:hypothetical protein [Metabacillus halosaccharovorans]|uniref:hypothetical protein n=1 Tax=Metabacillus halosaccharovorans TaxID=930124 RepID=UPI001C1FAD02|nr:hypothetical protein [Metabacillus halosaccharovorans]MBU7595129.1 hypothetical protein [Metabacillus halosaccharovorans]
MIISVIFGVASVGVGIGNDEPIVIITIMYLLTGVLPLIISFLLFEGRKAFKFNTSSLRSLLVNRGVRIYVLITIITPILLYVIDKSKFSNIDRLSSPGDVYFSTISIEWLGYLLVFTGLLAYVTFVGIFVISWKESNNLHRCIFIISLTISIFISVMMNNDYKAINQEGLAISTFSNKEVISWADVKHVNLKGSVTRDGFGKTSGNSFRWKFKFLLKNGEIEQFGPFSYTKHNLEDSLNIKELLADKNISLTTDQLLDEEWEYVQIDMKYEEDAKPEDFYSIFQYNPETREYYYIQY